MNLSVQIILEADLSGAVCPGGVFRDNLVGAGPDKVWFMKTLTSQIIEILFGDSWLSGWRFFFFFFRFLQKCKKANSLVIETGMKRNHSILWISLSELYIVLNRGNGVEERNAHLLWPFRRFGGEFWAHLAHILRYFCCNLKNPMTLSTLFNLI